MGLSDFLAQEKIHTDLDFLENQIRMFSPDQNAVDYAADVVQALKDFIDKKCFT